MEYIPGSIEKLWRELGVKPVPQEPCEGEDCFSFSEFINSFGRHKVRSMQGTITSYTSNDKLSKTGWAVMFAYSCECGSVHNSNAHGVWPTGDINKQIVQAKCPDDSSVVTDVELVRP